MSDAATRAKQRARWRRRYRREAARRDARARVGCTHCPHQIGRRVCMGRLETVVLPGGATKTICPNCARREAGICQRCDLPVAGKTRKSLYCRHHLWVVKLETQRRYYYEHLSYMRGRVREYQRARRAANPEYDRGKAREYRRQRKLAIIRGVAA